MHPIRILRLVVTVLAVVALAVPAIAGASSNAGHDQRCLRVQTSCADHGVVMTCCSEADAPAPFDRTSQGSDSHGAPGSNPVASTAAPSPMIAPGSAACTQSALRGTSPRHGHRLSDLPVLFSTLLI